MSKVRLFTVKEIAKHWNRSPVTIRWYMRQLGIEAVRHIRHNTALYTRQQLLACKPKVNGGNRR